MPGMTPLSEPSAECRSHPIVAMVSKKREKRWSSPPVPWGTPRDLPPHKGGTCKWQPPSVQKEKCAQPTTEAQRWAHAEADGSWLRNWPSMFWGLKLTPFLGSRSCESWWWCLTYMCTIYILVRLMLSTLVWFFWMPTSYDQIKELPSVPSINKQPTKTMCLQKFHPVYPASMMCCLFLWCFL